MKKELIYVVGALFCTPGVYAETATCPELEAARDSARTIQYTLTLSRDESNYDAKKWSDLLDGALRAIDDALRPTSRSVVSEEILQEIVEQLKTIITTKPHEDGIGGQLTISVSDNRICNCADDDCGCKIRSNGICECTSLNECAKSCVQKCPQKDTTACSQGCLQTRHTYE